MLAGYETGETEDETEDETDVSLAPPAPTIQIQGSDRIHPAVVIRESSRANTGRRVIVTISRTGKHANQYADYANIIAAYLQRTGKARGDIVGGGGGYPYRERTDAQSV